MASKLRHIIAKVLCVVALTFVCAPSGEAKWYRWLYNPFGELKDKIAGKMVMDPFKFGTLSEQTVQSIEEFSKLYSTVTNMTLDVSKVREVYTKVMSAAYQMEQTYELTASIYGNFTYIIDNLGRNVEQYARLADAGWLTPMELNNAILTSTGLVKYVIYEIGGFMDMVSTPMQWKPGEFLANLQAINAKLSMAVMGSATLDRKLKEDAKRREIAARARAMSKMALGQTNQKLGRKGKQMTYEELFAHEMEKYRNINFPDRKFDDGQSSGKKRDTAFDKYNKMLLQNLEAGIDGVDEKLISNKGATYRLAMVLLCIVGIIGCGIAAVVAMIEGDKQRLVTLIIGFIISLTVFIVALAV